MRHPSRSKSTSRSGCRASRWWGLPDPSVRESRDRIRSAIRNSGYEFPAIASPSISRRPTCARRASSFDLPIALGVLAASGVIARRDVDDVLILGELSLDGGIQAARGVLPIAAAARRRRFRGLLLPASNSGEAAVVDGLEFYPVRSLTEAVARAERPAPRRAVARPRRPSRRRRFTATSRTCAASRWRAGRWRSPRPAGTTSCSRGRPGPARR